MLLEYYGSLNFHVDLKNRFFLDSTPQTVILIGMHAWLLNYSKYGYPLPFTFEENKMTSRFALVTLRRVFGDNE